ncbi:hypothetical protein A0256_14170 [Mucilaginibacter sp. PAMC 26640]|nr:hypothetical protein A0256_14170 [Mucilaginibacter sp. PAMC 26640]
MKITINFTLAFAALFVANASSAQTRDSLARKDSLTQRLIAIAANKFPSTRTFNFEFSGAGATNFTSTLRGEALPAGRITKFMQARASANINFIQTRSWIVGASFSYRLTSLTAALDEPVSGLNSTFDGNFQYHASSLNVTKISRLFNKTTVFTGTFTIDGSEKQFERKRGLVTASMVLKSNAKTRLTVGLLGNFDPSTQTPILPIIAYEHRFDNGLIVDITLPRNIFIRKHVFRNGRITLGTELDRTSFYLYNLDNTGKTYEFRQVDINNGLIYEHRLFNYFILTAKGGLKLNPSARIFDRQESFNDQIFEAKPAASPYFNIGLSFNPFARKRR